LGLPGETLSSWKNSLYQVFDAGNHYGIDIIQCQLLENAEMNLSQRSIYKIKTKDVIDYMSQTTDVDEGPVETIAVVTETSTMPRQDMLEAQVWSSFMQLVHMSGFSSQISKYLNKAHAISYQRFYDGLYEYVKNDDYISSRLDLLRNNYDHWMEHGYLPHPITQDISQTGVNLITSLLLLVHVEHKIDHVHALIESYVDQSFSFLDQDLKNNLYVYQRAMIVKYEDLLSLPRKQTLDYDFYGYLDLNEDLNKPSTVMIDFSEDYNMSYSRFHENLYYGRKRGFGKSQVKQARS
jgi:Asp-tRNA(Asn)/Glu-tRNA(Gln) amidotransferase C subunit